MNRNYKQIKTLWRHVGRLVWVTPLYALALLLFPSGWAKAESHEIGNGGGSWVCRESNNEIRWAQLVDIFEAENEFGLTTATYSGAYTDIVNSMQLRLFEANRDLYQAVSDYLNKVDYLRNNPPQITYAADELQVIDDALYRLKPGAKRCKGGTIAYEQVVNYKQDGDILVQSDLFTGKNAGGNPNLSEVAKAVLVFHEAIYAYRRVSYDDKDSVVTRRIVGLIFSTLSIDGLKNELEKLGEGEVPITGMSFAKIPSGSFMMGSDRRETAL